MKPAETIASNDPQDLLKKATQLLSEKGLPGKKDEEYKYTAISQLLEKTFGKDLSPGGSRTLDEISGFLIPEFDCFKIILLNGRMSKQLSEIPEKLFLQEFDSDNIKGLTGFEHAESNSFVALNTVHFQKGIHLKLDKSVQLEKPVHIIHISNATDEKVVSMPRILIELGEQSKSEFYLSLGSNGNQASFTNLVSEISVGKAAESSLVQIQNESQSAITHNTSIIKLERDSRFDSNCISLGGMMTRNNLKFIIDDENIEAHLFGLYQLSGAQHVDNHTVVDHRKPNSVSNELYKGILNEKSTGAFNGKIFVRPDAQKTNAFQSNKNILLSDTATINTKPQLEIWADDVKCTHGCTTGQLDDDQIFYLQSRGISKELAVKMVLKAFQYDIVSKIKNEAVSNYLDEEITRKLGANTE